MKYWILLILTLNSLYSSFSNYEYAPTVSRISPGLGPPGQWIYVHGSNFVQNETYIQLGTLPAFKPNRVYQSTQLGFRLPAHASGTFSIKIITPFGEAVSLQTFTVGTPTDPPTITSFSPLLGPSSQWIYVYGSNFVGGQTYVTIAGLEDIQVSAVYSPGNLGFRLPHGALEGYTYITIRTPYGEATSDDQYFVGIPLGPPEINSLSIYFGAEWIYLSGANFVTGQTEIKIGESIMNATVYSPESLGFAPIQNWTSFNKIIVETPNGSAEKLINNLVPLNLQLEANKTYNLETSTDLINWTVVQDSINSESLALQILADNTEDEQKFYRLTTTLTLIKNP